MKKIVSMLCAFSILFSSLGSLAAKDDIIHTGLKKIYRSGTSQISVDLREDLLSGADQSLFYRELEDGRYVNVMEEEKAHIDFLRILANDNKLSTEKAIIAFLEKNQALYNAGIQDATNSKAKTFEAIKESDAWLLPSDSIEDFHQSSSAPFLSRNSFSLPEPGSRIGTVKLSQLDLPSGSFKWKTSISNSKLNYLDKNSNLSGLADYILRRDLKINAGEFLNLYAVNRNNMIIGFTSIEIQENMIRKAKVYPLELVEGQHFKGPSEGDNIGSTKFLDLDFLTVDADSFYLYKSKSNISIPELNSPALGGPYNSGDDIAVNIGDRILLTAVKNNQIKAYKLFIINKDHIKAEVDLPDKDMPIVLQAGLHFLALSKGSEVGTSTFDWLKANNLGNNVVWRYIVSEETIPLPELDSSFTGSEFQALTFLEKEDLPIASEEDIRASGSVSKNLMLLATLASGEDYKIKGYSILTANNNNVKLPAAGKLNIDEHYSAPVKGLGEYTSTIKLLKEGSISQFNQWRYKLLDEDPGTLEFNSSFSDSNFYSQGMDILVEGDKRFLVLAATDGYSKLKSYAVIQLADGMIRRKNASVLLPVTNYSKDDPSPGSLENTSKFRTLSFSTNVKGASKWMIAKAETSFGFIEVDSKVPSANDYSLGHDIEGLKIGDYIVLLATDASGGVKAFKEFQLGESHIRGGEAVGLLEGSASGRNYQIERGSKPGTTRFSNLKFDGVFAANSWRYKWMDKELSADDIPYLNQIVDGAEYYNSWGDVNDDINVSWISDSNNYGYILLLAVDASNKTKGYAVIPVDSSVVKEHAPELGQGVKLVQGTTVDKVAFELEGGKYIYLLGQSEYPTPAVGDSISNGLLYQGDITVRLGQHLTIFKVDESDKIIAFKRFIITSENIRQGSASFSLLDISTGNSIPEGSIVNGGTGIKVTLRDARWADLIGDKSKRDEFFSGFRADRDIGQWQSLVNKLIEDGGGISINASKDELTFYLPRTSGYDISQDQEISLNISPQAIEGAINPIQSSGSILIKPTIEARVSGQVIDNIVREKDIKEGGVEILISLKDGAWIGAIDKDLLIEGFVGGDQWNSIKEKYKTDGKLTRNSSKEITLTLAPLEVDLAASREDVRITIPKELVQGATIDLVATPIFSIYPDILKIDAKASPDTITMQAPDGKKVLEANDTWTIQLVNSTFVENLSAKDILISNLPRGLSYSIDRKSDDSIDLKLSGLATSGISGDLALGLILKGSAVNEVNSQDSDPIDLKISLKEALSFDGITYEIKDDGIYLDLGSNLDNNAFIGNVEYSRNSSNGVNGVWYKLMSLSTQVNADLSPLRVWVREISQPGVSEEIVDLKYAEIPNDVAISSVEYYSDNDKIMKRVGLSTTDKALNYSLDGGVTWLDYTSAPIDLEKDSDLRVRVSRVNGPGGSLGSLPSKRLNGLFLGDVSLNVLAGKIADTNTSMEYSLDSRDGSDGKWTRSSAGDTMVKFAKGNTVWIREASKKINARKLGDVGQKEKPLLYDNDGKMLVTYNIGDGELQNVVDKDLEYRLDGGSWFPLPPMSTTDDISFVSGDLDIRLAGDEKTLASASVTLDTIAEALEAPELKGNDDLPKTISYFDGEWKPIDDTFEYKIGSNGPWLSGEDFTRDDERFESVTVYVRKKASNDRLASLEKAISFTKNIVIKDVQYNVAKNLLEGVTSKVEYSVNSSPNLNNIWKKSTGTSVSIEAFEGMYIWIRESGKPSTQELFLENLQRQDKPILSYVYYNVETNKLANRTDQNLEYRIAGGDWSRFDSNSDLYGVEFIAGKLEFRKRASEGMMESHPASKVIIKARVSGPNIDFSDKDNKIISINNYTSSNDWKSFEYRIDPSVNSPWISGELLAGEDLSGDKILEIRKAADPKTLSSQITTINFVRNLELGKVSFSDHVHPHILNGTSRDMQYRIYLNKGQKTAWIECTNGDTLLPDWLKNNMTSGNVDRIEIRDGREGLNDDIFIIWPQ